jgi:hypothetical protein
MAPQRGAYATARVRWQTRMQNLHTEPRMAPRRSPCRQSGFLTNLLNSRTMCHGRAEAVQSVTLIHCLVYGKQWHTGARDFGQRPMPWGPLAMLRRRSAQIAAE